MSQRSVTEVVAAVIWDQDKFMICQRPAHKARGLLWEFVGGKVEPGETKEQALIRALSLMSSRRASWQLNFVFPFTSFIRGK